MARTAPAKSMSTSSALRQPIFRAEKNGPFRIERHRDRRLADLAANRFAADEQAFVTPVRA